MNVTLDIAADPADLLVTLVIITADFPSITYRVEAMEGPAAWPLVRFEGTAVDMSDFVLDYCAGDRRQAYELLMA